MIWFRLRRGFSVYLILMWVLFLLLIIVPMTVSWYISKPAKNECKHIYFPVTIAGKSVGQECAICHKYNSLEKVIGTRIKKEV